MKQEANNVREISQPEGKTSLGRFAFIVSCLAIALSALIFRIVDLQVLDNAFLQKQGDARTVRYEVLDAHRGMITDRNGEPLAVSTPVETLWVNPSVARDPTDSKKDEKKFQEWLNCECWNRVAGLLKMDAQSIRARLQSGANKEFVYLDRKVAPEVAQQVLALGVAGVHSRREYKRFYPAGEVATHLLGFVNIDENGQEGLELAYNDWLAGKAGKATVLKDRRGEVIKELGLVEDAQPGNPLQLSIDLRLQYLAYRELKSAVKAHKAKSASLVMLDVDTGEVLAMVNQPSYNPNNRKRLRVSSLRNRAMTDVFEPGSSMKPLTMAAALESGKFNPDSEIDTSPGYLRFGRSTIRDTHNYGVLRLEDIVAKSSNVGTSKIAIGLTGPVVWDMFYRMGLGQLTGLGFPGEGGGVLPQPYKWKNIQVATLSYGYGLNVTALQLAQSYLVLAADGVKRPLSLLKQENQPQGEQIISADVAHKVRLMLNKVVEKGGTGTRAQVASYRVGGKTGTVHAVGNSGYEESEYKALFAGMAPIDSPKVVMVVVVDAPQGDEYYGGEVAAPVFSRVMENTMRILNVTPDSVGNQGRIAAHGLSSGERG
ncbi:MAG: penicillin-binding protein 2 [Hahellaceae bacterium]|nr:penicillin-binding protein 2 [Hahellaceae bacterium]MCP5169849.1 penicillin-binding protein 2 [Hahellaceae bacterium]